MLSRVVVTAQGNKLDEVKKALAGIVDGAAVFTAIVINTKDEGKADEIMAAAIAAGASSAFRA